MSNTHLQPILIMAGGTGGHIFPALAVAKALQNENCDIHWLGAPDSMEARIVPNNDIELHTVNISGVRGKGLLTKLLMPIKLIKATLQSLHIIRKTNPAAVLGFGGFVTGPGGLAAWLSRRPLIIHEQNAIAGMTNRYLAKLAKHVYTAFANSFKQSSLVEVVGNPIREDIAQLHARHQAVKSVGKNILIMGGSLGAQSLNQIVPSAMALLNESERPSIIHQAGKRTFAAAKQAYSNVNVNAEVVEFIDDMANVYQWADLIICRAGALTVSEVAAAGLPAIFIPYPHAVDNHQYLNAKSLADAGGAIVITEEDLDASMLKTTMQELLRDEQRVIAMRQNSHAAAKLDAVTILKDKCLQYAMQNQGVTL